MGMHSPGWRETNEEDAWAAWRADVRDHVAALRAAADDAEKAAEGKYGGNAMAEAMRRADAASEALYNMRHGPENPSFGSGGRNPG